MQSQFIQKIYLSVELLDALLMDHQQLPTNSHGKHLFKLELLKLVVSQFAEDHSSTQAGY